MRKPSPISISSPRLMGTSAPGGERRQGQHHGRGVVVHRHAVLGAGQLGRGSRRGGRGATRARRRRGRTRGSSSRPQRARTRSIAAAAKRRPAEVGVHDDAGGVEHRAQARRAVEQPRGPCEQRLGRLGAAPPARASASAARIASTVAGAAVARDEVGGALVAEQGVDRRQTSQRVIGHGAIVRPHVPRQRRPTLYAMQSFGRRQRPRRLPPVRPLAASRSSWPRRCSPRRRSSTHRLWPLTDRAAGAIDAPGLPRRPAERPRRRFRRCSLVAGDAAGQPDPGVDARAAIVVDRTSGPRAVAEGRTPAAFRSRASPSS